MPRWQRIRGQRTLSVVMIVKNEAHNLPHLFRTIADVADEVVVVDTGSDDDTVAVCRAWGVKLIHDPWQNDFSRARNRSIEGATAKYLMWLDADDRLPPEMQHEIRELRDRILPMVQDEAYVLQVHNLDASGGLIDVFLQTRIFPRRPGVRFRNAIHEQIADSLQENGIELVRTHLIVHHTGYADKEVVRAKALRNEVLLQKALDEEPRSIHHRVHMAQNLAGLGRYAEADRMITGVMEDLDPSVANPRVVAELYSLRASYRSVSGGVLQALQDLERSIELWPEWAIPYAALAEIYHERGTHDDAWSMVQKARGAEFVPGMIGFPLARAQSNIEWVAGRVLLHRGKREKAVASWFQALEHYPKNLDARMALGQALLDLERYAEAKTVLEPAGEDEFASSRFVDVASAIGLARAMSGDEPGAQACLMPLLDIFAEALNGAEDVGPIELAEAMLRAGHSDAAKNMVTLFQKTLQAVA